MDAEKLRSLQIAPEVKGRSHTMTWWIFIAVAVIASVTAYLAWPRQDDSRRLFKNPARKMTPTATDQVARSAASRSDQASGAALDKTQSSVLTVSGYIVNRERIEISPRFLGEVKWIGVRKGDAVTNGQVLVLLDDAEQKARVREAEGRLATAEAAAEKARINHERIKQLIRDKIETQQAEDDARLQLEAARATVKEMEGSVALARTYLDWTIIKSPVDGVVLEKLVDAGELVTPQSFGGTRGPSTALLAVADPKDLQVEIDLNESDLAKVFKGQKCKVSPEAYPNKSYGGYVAEIAPEANRQKGTLQVKVQIQNPDLFLTPELSAKVDFLPGAEEVRAP
jgi:HlyD family secretion protein